MNIIPLLILTRGRNLFKTEEEDTLQEETILTLQSILCNIDVVNRNILEWNDYLIKIKGYRNQRKWNIIFFKLVQNF